MWISRLDSFWLYYSYCSTDTDFTGFSLLHLIADSVSSGCALLKTGLGLDCERHPPKLPTLHLVRLSVQTVDTRLYFRSLSGVLNIVCRRARRSMTPACWYKPLAEIFPCGSVCVQDRHRIKNWNRTGEKEIFEASLLSQAAKCVHVVTLHSIRD